MKIRHRVPPEALRSDPITPEYQAEVDAATARLSAAYERAERRLRKAEERQARLAARFERLLADERETRVLRAARETVDRRREELLNIARSMRSAPSSSAHRGREGTPPPVHSPGELF